MLRSMLVLAPLVLVGLGGCLEDDPEAGVDAAVGGSGGGGEGGAGGVGGEGGMGGMGGEGGVGGTGGGAPSGLDCDAVCTGYDACPGALAIIDDCNDCEDISEALAAEPSAILERAAAVCMSAVETGDCRAYALCLTDDDGHNAGAYGGVTVEVAGEGAPVELTVADAWAVVGAKSDGAPGDLEVYFESEGGFYGLAFDDLALAVEDAPLDADDHPVIWSSADAVVEYEVGETAIETWALDGAFAVTATLMGEAGALTIRVSGAFEPAL